MNKGPEERLFKDLFIQEKMKNEELEKLLNERSKKKDSDKFNLLLEEIQSLKDIVKDLAQEMKTLKGEKLETKTKKKKEKNYVGVKMKKNCLTKKESLAEEKIPKPAKPLIKKTSLVYSNSETEDEISKTATKAVSGAKKKQSSSEAENSNSDSEDKKPKPFAKLTSSQPAIFKPAPAVKVAKAEKKDESFSDNDFEYEEEKAKFSFTIDQHNEDSEADSFKYEEDKPDGPKMDPEDQFYDAISQSDQLSNNEYIELVRTDNKCQYNSKWADTGQFVPDLAVRVSP